MIESGFRSQVLPDSPQDTPPEPKPRPTGVADRASGLAWGVGTVLAAMVLLSTLVLGSYQGHHDRAADEPDPVADPVAAGEPARLADDSAPAAPAPPSEAPAEAPVEAPAPPPGAEHVPVSGSGAVTVAAFTRPAPPTQGGRPIRVRVEVEREMPVDAEAVAKQAADILQDDRSWPAKERVRFDFVGDQRHDLVIRVLTPSTTDARCRPLRTLGEVSCSVGSAVNLNGVRWTVGVPDYAGDLNGYRTYLVNHEVGHYLGYGHVACPGRGEQAPVMMQQTKGLKGCTRNVWP